MNFLEVNKIHQGRSEILMKQIEPESVALSFWSPPYFVGKEYEKDETFDSWQAMLRQVIHHHSKALKPGGFLVINIGDIRCFKDESIPRFQAMNIYMLEKENSFLHACKYCLLPTEIYPLSPYIDHLFLNPSQIERLN